jgi:TolB-like protein
MTVTAWARDRLAILPFTGGQGEDGETIAELFSFEKELASVFDPVPRTSINAAIRNEQRFQMTSGMTDPDAIAALGKQLGARYVVAGSITKLGNRNLLIIAIVHIEDLRQIAGDVQTYGSIGEIRGRLPAMARSIVAASKTSVSNLPLLAVPPVQLSGGADAREADALAQILAVHIIRSGKYAVYPRTKSLEQVQSEYGNQFNGDVADEYLPKLEAGENPRFVLSVMARTLDGEKMFNAVIINLETGAQAAGDTADYRSLNDDGMHVMEILSLKLSGKKAEAARQENVLKKAAETVRRKQEAQRTWSAFKSGAARLFEDWSMSVGVGTTFTTPVLTLTPAVTIPIAAYLDVGVYLDVGCDFGFLTNADYIEDLSYNSYYPYVRASVFVPIGDSFGFHSGLGYGCMIADYQYGVYDVRAVVHAFDFAVGFLLINALDLSYSIRTDFKNVNHKLSIGYVYRLGIE